MLFINMERENLDATAEVLTLGTTESNIHPVQHRIAQWHAAKAPIYH